MLNFDLKVMTFACFFLVIFTTSIIKIAIIIIIMIIFILIIFNGTWYSNMTNEIICEVQKSKRKQRFFFYGFLPLYMWYKMHPLCLNIGQSNLCHSMIARLKSTTVDPISSTIAKVKMQSCTWKSTTVDPIWNTISKVQMQSCICFPCTFLIGFPYQWRTCLPQRNSSFHRHVTKSSKISSLIIDLTTMAWITWILMHNRHITLMLCS